MAIAAQLLMLIYFTVDNASRLDSVLSDHAGVYAPHAPYSVLAREKLEHPNVRAVYATDAVPIAEKGWTKLHVVSIAPLIANALAELLTAASCTGTAAMAERRRAGRSAPRPC